MEDAALRTDVQTLCIGNVFNPPAIVQVHAEGVRLVDGGRHMQNESLPAVRSAYLCQPYLVVLLADGSLRLFVANPVTRRLDMSTPSLPPLAPHLHGVRNRQDIECIYLYSDTQTGLFRNAPAPTHARPTHENQLSQQSADSDLLHLSGAATLHTSIAGRITSDCKGEAVTTGGLKRDSADKIAASTASFDELDEILLGEADPDADFLEAPSASSSFLFEANKPRVPSHDSVNPNSFVCLVIRRGELEVYSVPGFQRVWRSSRLSAGFTLLLNQQSHSTSVDNCTSFGEGIAVAAGEKATTPRRKNRRKPADPAVSELCLAQVGSAASQPFLLAFLSNGDLLVYRSFHHFCGRDEQSSARFRRIDHGLITRPVLGSNITNKQNSLANPSNNAKWKGGLRFSPLPNASGRSALLIGGHYPVWLFGERDFYRFHPMLLHSDMVEPERTRHKAVPAAVSCSAAVHFQDMEHCFVYFDARSLSFNVCSLPRKQFFETHTVSRHPVSALQQRMKHEPRDLSPLALYDHIDFDHDFPMRFISLGCTAHFVARHAPTNTYAVVISKKIKIPCEEETTERSLDVHEDRFEVLLYRAHSWDVIGRFDGFAEHEVVLAFSSVELNNNVYLVLGTSNMQGEEVAAKGRIILLNLFFQVGRSHTGESSQMVKVVSYHLSERGPVTAIDAVDDLLCVAVGPRMKLYVEDKYTHNEILTKNNQPIISFLLILSSFLLIETGCNLFALPW